MLIAAFVSIVPCQRAEAQINLSKAASVLTSSNGIAAGTALLSLYTQYKADGKLDFSNASNISNLVKLVSNIKGLKSASSADDGFVSGLISGSDSLVNEGNSSNVLSSLSSISNLDTSSLKSAAASSLVSGLGGSSKKSSGASSAVSTASSVLGSLFKGL